ncbi:MAG: hypothetical protein P8Y70_18250 [Candidatus Lokiarchaeota archaeon]
MFCEINNRKIPLVMVGTSPFVGSSQFQDAKKYRKKFLHNPDAMLEILETSYKNGAKGMHVIDAGEILNVAQIMKETHDDFIITGSTVPGPDPHILPLVNVGAELIFIHGNTSKNMGEELINLVEEIADLDIIPGLALHNPFTTLNYALHNLPQVNTFLVPFNEKGLYMENKEQLEALIDNNTKCNFIGMKTLAAGKLSPNKAFEYISSHNISSVAVGITEREQATETITTALKYLI